MRQLVIATRLALATSRAIGRERAYWVVLVAIGALIPVSAELALFAMGSRATLVREMGLASLVLGGLSIAVFVGHYQPGEDLRGGTGAQILATPIRAGSYVIGRLAGLAVAVSLATAVWSLILAGTLARHDAGALDAGTSAATAATVSGTIAIAAALQRISLALGPAPTAACGILIYLAGQLAGLVHMHAGATLGPAASLPLRLLPALSSTNLTAAAAHGWLIPPAVGILASAHGALYAAAFALWTADALARRGAVAR